MGKYQNEDLIEVFEDTRRWCRSEKALREAVEHSLAETKLYSVGEELHYDKSRYAEPVAVSVSTRRTFEAARELHEKLPNAKIAVLNFASATNPGGGVARGSRAQEESLCRCSTLYPVLADPKYWGAFYGFHRKRHDARYTDLCLYTPGVKVIKSDTALPERLDEKDWLSVDVITCAAPNLRERPSNEMNPQAGEALHLSDEELLALHKKRGRRILAVAAANEADVLVLGAFGCGAFRNPPEIVAKAYRELLPEFDGCFERVEFAVYCTPQARGNYEAFARAMQA